EMADMSMFCSAKLANACFIWLGPNSSRNGLATLVCSTVKLPVTIASLSVRIDVLIRISCIVGLGTVSAAPAGMPSRERKVMPPAKARARRRQACLWMWFVMVVSSSIGAKGAGVDRPCATVAQMPRARSGIPHKERGSHRDGGGVVAVEPIQPFAYALLLPF